MNTPSQRRMFLRGAAQIAMVSALPAAVPSSAAVRSASRPAYQPAYFTAAEWAFINAAVDRAIEIIGATLAKVTPIITGSLIPNQRVAPQA